MAMTPCQISMAISAMSSTMGSQTVSVWCTNPSAIDCPSITPHMSPDCPFSSFFASKTPL